MSNSISIYGSHDASICVKYGDIYRVFEIERITQQRFSSLYVDNYQEIYQLVNQLIEKEYGKISYKCLYHLAVPEEQLTYLKQLFQPKHTILVNEHHLAHVASCFYQSPFSEAIVISYDGGGMGGDGQVSYFNIYQASSKGFTKLKSIPYDLGTAYGLIALPISEIAKTPENWGDKFLSFAGKMMGLVAYGKIRPEWMAGLKKFYQQHKHVDIIDLHKTLDQDLQLPLGFNTLSGQDSYDLAVTSQAAFESVIWDEITPFLNYNLPICLTGGCALNVIFNQKLKDYYSLPIFVPPNPSDCGLSFGMLAFKEPPIHSVDLTYSGLPILDLEQLAGKEVSISEVAQLLFQGKIIGVVQGNSEHGPRALGHRSILCHPGLPEMKEIINAKVKFREWFRPFAPVVCQENVNKYFEFEGSSVFMSYAPLVRKEWKEKLSAIVHQDGTARVQTITSTQNSYLYNLLKEFEKLSGIDILLNTSFNIKGKPILSTIKDALQVLQETQLDAVLVENRLYVR